VEGSPEAPNEPPLRQLLLERLDRPATPWGSHTVAIRSATTRMSRRHVPNAKTER